MAGLAIKGHPTRGKEIIEILEMLGGVNKYQIGAIRQTYVYFIDIDNTIRLLQINQLLPEKDIVYSLEEFLEKYPYKVGDKVVYKFINTYVIDTIKSMKWYANGVVYTLKEYEEELMAEDLQFYKEEESMKSKYKS